MARTPHPRSLEYITPSQLIEGESCLWRLGFSSDPQANFLRRSGPAAALGTAAHEVKSRLGDALGFEAVWNQAVSRAADRLKAEWAPASPPSPENWPGWSLTRVRMKKLWEHTSASKQEFKRRSTHGPKPQGSGPVPLPWTERWLRHKSLPLAGRPDLVERVDREVWVVDLKTGLAQSEPSPAQRQQLLFYCELVRSELGESPTVAAVESTRGARHSLPVVPGEVQEVIDRAITMLNTLNSAGESGLNESLANPSESTCGWCPFRPVCGPFFRAYDESWPIAHALLFRVRSIVRCQHGYEVEATVLKPRWREGEDVHIVGFPFDPQAQAGQVWGAVDFVGRANSAVADWNTRLTKWTADSG